MTRKRLEEKITSLQKELDDTIQSKDYKAAGPLQDKLDELTSLRNEYPTLEELNENLKKAEEAVASAAKRRDFANAASLQLKVENAKKRLKEAVETDDESVEEVEEQSTSLSIDGIESRVDLEKELQSLHEKVDLAISKKDFQAASKLQAQIDEREKLRSMFPSLEELEKRLEETKAQLEDAISSKNFESAAKLSEKISSLEKKIHDEKEKENVTLSCTSSVDGSTRLQGLDGKEFIYESRRSLETEIKRHVSMQAHEISLKNFNKAQDIQSFIDRLEALRESFPTISELRQKISKKKEEMDVAIRAKKFTDADKLDREIGILEVRLTSELKSDDSEGSIPSMDKRSRNMPSEQKETTSQIRLDRIPTLKVSSDDTAKSLDSKLHGDSRQVAKLRPKKPLVSSVGDSVLSVTQMLASKRGSASLVVSDEGGLAGIITDTDITRRLVANQLKASSTSISKVMTPNPTCVSLSDSAMDAMTTMVENHFRHLPVVDDKGGVVGLLDIAKCLNDAISKLEKSDSKSGSVAQEALSQAMHAQGAQGAQAAALQALLGPLMSQAFGNQASPNLRSLLAGKPSTIVHPGTSVYKAGIKMADSKKAALVVEDGTLVGIFGFKDMMTRVIAKELPLQSTKISAVMTPNPEFVSPDMTVLEALQTMHDNKFLTLPVCEDDGAVVGLVNVMDVIYGCGGADGWRSIFNTTLDLDDLSDEFSKSEVESNAGKSKSTISKNRGNERGTDCRTVAKLKPKKPLVSSVGDSVLSVTQMLASKRGSASLVVSDEGGLAGIITDTDITRRLVANQLKASSTSISKVMTPNPTCVSLSDSAMDAMTTMVENHFRHLPVVDDKGGVVGLLDIAKCLNDAISKLEKSDSKSGSVAQEALSQAMHAQGAQGAQAAALQALLGPLMSQAFGNQASPNLRSLLAGKPSTIVHPGTSVYKAGIKMADSKKAALVVEDGTLVGIFGFKDMMTRVIAKELPLQSTKISAVMTPNPEFVSPDMTVLEALQTMHDNKFLTLPVCEDDGAVVGLVNVMDVIYGCGGADGWRSIFNTTLDLDDISDSVSYVSGRSNPGGVVSRQLKLGSQRTIVDKTVKDLRPKTSLIASIGDSILAVSKNLACNRRDAAIIVDTAGQIKGILTDTDITRRVVTKGVDVTRTTVADVMTPNPKCVEEGGSAMEAMMLMIENRFRHIPVVNQENVVGTLDIAKCLNDAISKLEASASAEPNATENMIKEALAAIDGSKSAGLESILFPLLNKAIGTESRVPLLGSIATDSTCPIVSPETSVLDAAYVMAEKKKATLIVDNGQLVGIFGFKDMMTRVVAAELDHQSTTVSMVMTPDPEFAEPDMTAIEALKMMHDNRFLSLPVCDVKGTIIGLLDVMDLIHACGGVEHWRSVLEMALKVEDGSINESVLTPPMKNEVSTIQISKDTPMVSSQPPIPSNIPSTLEFRKGLNEDFDETTLNDTYRMESGSFISDGNVVTFKIVDPDGHTHRIRSEVKILSLREVLDEKLKGRIYAKNLSLKFFDEEGDAIFISTDDDLAEAVSLARNSPHSSKFVVKLVAELDVTDSGGLEPAIAIGIGIAVAFIALGSILFFPAKQKASRY